MGDAVHTMPDVQDIRRVPSHAQIDWVVELSFAPLIARCEGVRYTFLAQTLVACQEKLNTISQRPKI